MTYKQDENLDFLKNLSSKELASLADILSPFQYKDEDEKFASSENDKQFLISLSNNYEKYGSDYAKYWQDIATKLQYLGGSNTCVEYRVIAERVTKDLDVKANQKDSISELEEKILLGFFKKAIEELDESERQELAKDIKLDIDFYTPESLVTAVQRIFKVGGFKSYQLTLIIANAVLKTLLGKGLEFDNNPILTRTAVFLREPIRSIFPVPQQIWGKHIRGMGEAKNPFGGIFNLGFGVYSDMKIANPVNLKVILATVQIAVLRKTYLSQLDKAFLDELNEVDEETKKSFGLYS